MVVRDLPGKRQEMVASPWCDNGATSPEEVMMCGVRKGSGDTSLTPIAPVGVLKAEAEAIDGHGQCPGEAGVQEEGAIAGAH